MFKIDMSLDAAPVTAGMLELETAHRFTFSGTRGQSARLKLSPTRQSVTLCHSRINAFLPVFSRGQPLAIPCLIRCFRLNTGTAWGSRFSLSGLAPAISRSLSR